MRIYVRLYSRKLEEDTSANDALAEAVRRARGKFHVCVVATANALADLGERHPRSCSTIGDPPRGYLVITGAPVEHLRDERMIGCASALGQAHDSELALGVPLSSARLPASTGLRIPNRHSPTKKRARPWRRYSTSCRRSFVPCSSASSWKE